MPRMICMSAVNMEYGVSFGQLKHLLQVKELRRKAVSHRLYVAVSRLYMAVKAPSH